MSLTVGRRGFVCEVLERRQLLSAAIKLGTPALSPGLDQPRLPAPSLDELLVSPKLGVAPPPSAAPTGPIDPVAEYEPMEGLSISWAGSSTQKSMLAQIARRVTVEASSRMYIAVNSAAAQTEAINSLNTQGANMSRVTFFSSAYDTIWSRDYGPRYVYEGDVRVISDHKYNRVRPNDDNLPYVLGQQKAQKVYEMGLNGTQLTHGGGNYHLNATGDAYATRLITQENSWFTEPQIQQIYDTYQNNDLSLTNRFPTNVESTGHIDMWMQSYEDNKVFINDCPLASGSTWEVICVNAATLMQSRG
jgi:agmatine/peptidylarginine deiminase